MYAKAYGCSRKLAEKLIYSFTIHKVEKLINEDSSKISQSLSIFIRII